MTTRHARGLVSLGRWTGIVCAALAVLVAAPSDARAQEAASGRVQGLVLDTTGQPLPGVLVEVETGVQPLSARTSADGRYLVEAVPAGTHTVRFSLSSFVTLQRRNVVVTTGAATTADETNAISPTKRSTMTEAAASSLSLIHI